jgi:hypothetical protein
MTDTRDEDAVRPRRGDEVSDRRRAEALHRSSTILWTGFLAPPALALLNVIFGFPLAYVACNTSSTLLLHLFMCATLALVVVAGLLAGKEWSALGTDDPGELSGPLGSRRLLALLGVTGASISVFFVLSQWYPVFVLGPCMRA